MKKVNFLFFILMLPLAVFSHDITGTVVDGTQEPIDGAYVLLLNSNYHTHTNEFGNFVVKNANEGDTLQIMYLGYETQYIEVKNPKEEITVEMVESIVELGEIVVAQNSKQSNIISNIDIQTTPVKSSQEILRKVPGLFIGQHAGGGKAEQIFLRGFDIDHGTDVNLTVDGMPVNMVSHAHGQGYSDLHFLIPETIDQLDFGKGTYYADKGNFGTAGYVAFKTKDKVEKSQVGLEVGSFNTLRTVGLFNILNKENHHAYLASEYIISDGPFDSSQNFVRSNFMGKYTGNVGNKGRLSILASHFSSTWDASGQIPVRAVEQGLIDRFGAIDDTEGGKTGRTNIAVGFNKIVGNNTSIKNNLYYSLYNFELFSNFTFFLNDPINGDQIRQYEDRQLFGYESVIDHSFSAKNSDFLLSAGAGFRNDLVKGNELSRTLNRSTTLTNIQLGDVDEKNLYTFASLEWDVGAWLFEPAVRLDVFKFNYINSLDTLYNHQSQTKVIASPKFNIIYNMNNNVQLFVKTGMGFHSNDTRVIMEEEGITALPAAYGADIGTIVKPTKRMIANIALWYLFLEQEFVYVGDEGVVEPSGRTRRMGVDVGLRYQLTDWMFANADANYAFARSIDDDEGANLIPLAPIITATAGLSVNRNNFTSSLQFRYLGDRPATEDNSIVAEGYAITDLSASYTYKKVSFGFTIENLFNQEWNETQFATESRLQNELESVEEIHFTPGTPFNIRGTLRYEF